MSKELTTWYHGVDATTRTVFSTTTGEAFQVMNAGDNTVFVGAVTRTGSDIVDASSAWPINPGEKITVPAFDTEAGGSVFTAGFNTKTGNSIIRILATRTY